MPDTGQPTSEDQLQVAADEWTIEWGGWIKSPWVGTYVGVWYGSSPDGQKTYVVHTDGRAATLAPTVTPDQWVRGEEVVGGRGVNVHRLMTAKFLARERLVQYIIAFERDRQDVEAAQEGGDEVMRQLDMEK